MLYNKLVSLRHLPKKAPMALIAVFLILISALSAFLILEYGKNLNVPSNQQQTESIEENANSAMDSSRSNNIPPPSDNNEGERFKGDSDTPAILVKTFSTTVVQNRINYSSIISGAQAGYTCVLTAQHSDGTILSTTTKSNPSGCEGVITDSRIVTGSTWSLTVTYRYINTESASRKIVIIP